MNSMKKYIAEFIGTFVLVLMACGTAVALGCTSTSPDVAYLATALAFGLVIVAMAYSIGNISGCHINPAVSLAMLISKKMSIKEFAGYLVAQFAGATAGAALLGWFFNGGFGANTLCEEHGVTILMGLAVEIILTFIFVLVILGVTSKEENKGVAGVVIGLTLTLVHILGIYFTGTSVNPARSFGPALFTGGDALAQLWIFIVAPLVGGALAALVYGYLTSDKKRVKKQKKDAQTDDELVDAYVAAFETGAEAPAVEVPVDALVEEIVDTPVAE